MRELPYPQLPLARTGCPKRSERLATIPGEWPEAAPVLQTAGLPAVSAGSGNWSEGMRPAQEFGASALIFLRPTVA